MFSVRPARFPEDYPGIARVKTAESPEYPATPEELAYEDSIRDPQELRIVLVAEAQDGEGLVGVATAGRDSMAHREGRVKIDLRVPPDLQGRGIGKALYGELLRSLAPLRPQELVTQVWAALERPRRFVAERGFVEAWQRVDSTLKVAGFDFSPFDGLEQRLNLQGIQIKTYAELEGNPHRLEKLWALDVELWEDVPYGEPVTRPSLERFERELIRHPDFIPEACFVAVAGEEFAGYSLLLRGDGYFDTDMTGVRRAYRGSGLALLLKLKSICYAQEHGGCELRTVNDSVNTAILALNEKLGFQRQGANIRYIKKLV